MSEEFDIETFRMRDGQAHVVVEQATEAKPKPQRLPAHVRGTFVRSVPLSWISQASALPGKAVLVALACWYAAGRARAATAQVTPKVLRELGLNRKSFRLGLARIEAAGMVCVDRHRGRSPVVTIICLEGKAND